MPLVETAAGDAGPLRQIDRLGEHVAGIGPRAAGLTSRSVEPGDDAPPALVLVDDDALLGEMPLVLGGAVDDHRRAEDAMSVARLADLEVVERRPRRLRPQLGDDPADRPRETQVLGGALRAPPPAHAARHLDAGDELRHEVGEDGERLGPRSLDLGDDELDAVDRLAAEVGERQPLAPREPLAGLRRRAVRVDGDRGPRAPEPLRLALLPFGNAGDEDGDAPRRDEDPDVVPREVGPQKARFGEEPLGKTSLAVLAPELTHHRLAEPVGQLLAADLDEQGLAAHPSSAPSRAASRSAWTSRYRRATLRAKSRTRAMCAVRSVTLITPRASSRLNVWLHLRTWS